MLKETRREGGQCDHNARTEKRPSPVPVGRRTEFGRLADALAGCLAGGGRVVTVSGPVASGKTELLRGFAEQATAQGAVFVGAAGSAMEKDFPFGVLRQLVQAAPLQHAVAERAVRLLDESSFPASVPGDPGAYGGTDRGPYAGPYDGTHAGPYGATGPGTYNGTPAGTHPGAAAGAHQGNAQPGGRLAARVRHELCSVLLRLAESTPVVIGVDDLQHADAESVGFLLYLARRIGAARVLVVLTERELTAPAHPPAAAELDRQPSHERIRLDLLPSAAVAELFRGQAGLGDADRLATEAYAVSGGNPLLVNALMEDAWAGSRARVARAPGTPPEAVTAIGPREPRTLVGDSFRRGVMSCLYRMEATSLQVARALAVLGGPATVERLDDLLGARTAETACALQTLHAAGLLDDGRFRHPAAQAAVLDGMARAERERMHRRVAALLHSDGAAPADVARHLVAAGRIEGPWAMPTLHRAAEQAMGCGDVRLALDCLKLAQRNSAGDREQAEATALLTGLEWLLDPAAATRHVPWLSAAVQDGRLHGRYALLAVRCFAWYGLIDEATRALDMLGDAASGVEVETAAEAWTASTLLAFWYPELRGRATALSDWTRDVPAIRSRLDGLDVLIAVQNGQGDDRTVARAEQILRRRRLADSTMESLNSALMALIYAGKAERTDRWTQELLEQADLHHAPIAYALLSAVRAESALRQGNLVTAVEAADAALERVSPDGWGVLVGIPLATAIAANTERGRYEEAARWIDVPVPNVMFRTPAGLHYLHACGRYNLAIGRPKAALHAFRTCGELMREWGMDVSGIVPWRVESAKAHLRLGDTAEAGRLLREELDRLSEEPSRSRAMALRVYAATLDVRQRPSVLWDAATMAQAVGDQYEAAVALAELGTVYRGLGAVGRTRSVVHKAVRLAKECDAGPLYQALAADHAAVDGELAEARRGPGPEDAATELSEAERRVAALAAQGHKNREIARTLFITVSTVEQHLTRVYRKLGVTRRLDLPAPLPWDIAG